MPHHTHLYLTQKGGEGHPREQVSLLGDGWLIHRSMGYGMCYGRNIWSVGFWKYS